MKKALLSVTFAMATVFGINAQVGAVATDFTVTDINGNSFNLYSVLNDGKAVVLDCSATWCGPCWGFHQAHFLQDLHDQLGPNGTDQIRVVLYEADASTGSDALNGTGGSTLGNWLADSPTYPVVNEDPVQLSGNMFWPLGFPTINVICPAEKKIKSDLFDIWNQQDAAASLQAFIAEITSCPGLTSGGGTASIAENSLDKVSVFPNPSNGDVVVGIPSNTSGNLNIEVTNLLGQVVFSETKEIAPGTTSIELDLNALSNGQYVMNLSTETASKTKKVQIRK